MTIAVDDIEKVAFLVALGPSRLTVPRDRRVVICYATVLQHAVDAAIKSLSTKSSNVGRLSADAHIDGISAVHVRKWSIVRVGVGKTGAVREATL